MTALPRRMILSVDTGVDDALALALAVRHPDIQLDAVLTSCGNVGLAQVNDNTLRVLDLLGGTDIPVFAGADRPLAAPFLDAAHFHGDDGLGGARLPASTRRVAPDAVGQLIARVHAEPGVLTLVCTGPLTNLALALQRDPSIVPAIAQVVLMGGAAHPPGNTTPVAEYNIVADVEAAALVFQQSWPLTMVGLDVTTRVPLTASDLHRLRDHDAPEALLLREVTRHAFVVRGLDAISLHDPLAVGVALDPSLVTTLAGPVVVETRGEYSRGQTIVDLRPRVARPPSATRVAMTVEVERFRQLFFGTLGFSLR